MMINGKIKALLRVILPVIFITYACSITFFTHTHIVNGVTIVHSHPFLTDEDGNLTHEHTPAEIQLIQVLSTFFSAALIALFFLFGLFQVQRIILAVYQKKFLLRGYVKGAYTLRPPPGFIV